MEVRHGQANASVGLEAACFTLTKKRGHRKGKLMVGDYVDDDDEQQQQEEEEEEEEEERNQSTKRT